MIRAHRIYGPTLYFVSLGWWITGDSVASGGMRADRGLLVGLALPPFGSAVTKTMFKCARVLVSLKRSTHRF